MISDKNIVRQYIVAEKTIRFKNTKHMKIGMIWKITLKSLIYKSIHVLFMETILPNVVHKQNFYFVKNLPIP